MSKRSKDTKEKNQPADLEEDQGEKRLTIVDEKIGEEDTIRSSTF